MAQSLAVKYRPSKWEDVIGQESVVKILTKQIETGAIKNAYLFTGITGAGKTTASRLLATEINKAPDSYIEIDAASNNSAEKMRAIVKSAQERSIDYKYKIFIIDEVHALSNQAWQVMLKCLEEPPEFTIFILCTTDAQKIPTTILNRVQRFNISRISEDNIFKRLQYICEQENLVHFEDTISYISKTSDGSMRTAISLLEKCAALSTDLDINITLSILGAAPFSLLIKLTNALIDSQIHTIFTCMSDIDSSYPDLKIFLDRYIDFILDILKYYIFKTLSVTSIPSNLEKEIKNLLAIENAQKYFQYVLDKLLSLKQIIKNDSNIQSSIEIVFLQIARGK